MLKRNVSSRIFSGKIPTMARPRKSRLAPSLITFADELVRIVGGRVDRAMAELRSSLEGELKAIRRDVSRLQSRSRGPAAPPPAGGRPGRPRSFRVCSERGCNQPHVARGLCKNHYQQLR